jgi:hypothetical protein
METRQTYISEYQDTSWTPTTSTGPSTNGCEAGEGEIRLCSHKVSPTLQSVSLTKFSPPAEPLPEQQIDKKVYCHDKPLIDWSSFGFEQIPSAKIGKTTSHEAIYADKWNF